MKVKEFFENFSCTRHCHIELYEINDNIYIDLDIDEFQKNDTILHEEWKNATVDSWSLADNEITVNVIK